MLWVTFEKQILLEFEVHLIATLYVMSKPEVYLFKGDDSVCELINRSQLIEFPWFIKCSLNFDNKKQTNIEELNILQSTIWTIYIFVSDKLFTL